MKVCINSGTKNSLRRIYNKISDFCTIKPNVQMYDTWECSMPMGQVIHTGCISSKNHIKGAMAIGSMPDYYTLKRKVHIKTKPEYWTAQKNGQGRAVKCEKETPGAKYHPAVTEHDEIWKNWSDHYYIDQLFGDSNGAGTRQVQKIVLQSLKDS